MTPWHSSSLACFSLLTACLFGYVAIVDSTVAELCDKWKNDTNQNFLAMGIITGVGGESRFYAVSTDFEGITVTADQLHVPVQIEGQANVYPHLHLENEGAEALDLSSAKASWAQMGASPTNGKNAFILAFKPEAGLYSGEQFLAFISKNSSQLFLASLTHPDAQVKKVSLLGDYPPAGIVFSTDNKVATPGDASVVAALRYATVEETNIFDGDLRRGEGDSLSSKFHHNAHPSPLTPSLAIDGGFLLNGDQPGTSRLLALSNAQRKMYIFYGDTGTAPVEVPFTDFLLCPPPNDWRSNALKVTGIAVPVIVVIGAVFFFMSAKKKKNSGARSAVSGNKSTVSGNSGRYATSVNSTAASTGFAASVNSTAASTAGKSTFTAASGKPSMMALTQASSTESSAAASSLGKFKTRSAGKPLTPNKPRTANKKPHTAKGKPRTANQKPLTPNQESFDSPGMLVRSMESSPGPKPGVFKFKAAK